MFTINHVGIGQDRVIRQEIIIKGGYGKEMYYYEKNLFNGIMFEKYENNVLKYEWNIKNGKKDGLCRWFYDNGQLKWEVNFKDEKYNGLYRRWYLDGRLMYKTKFIK